MRIKRHLAAALAAAAAAGMLLVPAAAVPAQAAPAAVPARSAMGTRLVVYVHGIRAGTMTVSRSGHAHLDLARGVPACGAGQPVRVRTMNGALIASGTFYRHW